MKLKNSALQDLYDTIVASTITISPYEASPIDKAFKECDEKLSDSIAFVHVKDLQDRNDILEKGNKALLEANLELASKKRQLEKARDNADRQLTYFMHSRDDWRSRAKHAEKEAEDLASQYQKLTIENKRLLDANTTLEKASDDRTNLQEACDKLSGENRRLNARIECLREEVNWYRKHYRENLNKVLNTARDDGYESGQKDLWDMLQEVSDYYYFGGDDEFDTDDCEMISMTDIIDNLNVNQFLEAYKNWHKEQKQTWECTLEGNIKINGDLLGKVFGIKIDDD